MGYLVPLKIKDVEFPILSFLKTKDKFIAQEFVEEKSYLIAVSVDNLRQEEIFAPKVIDDMGYKALTMDQFNEKYGSHIRMVQSICNSHAVSLSWIGKLQAAFLLSLESSSENSVEICKNIHDFQEKVLPIAKDPFQ